MASQGFFSKISLCSTQSIDVATFYTEYYLSSEDKAHEIMRKEELRFATKAIAKFYYEGAIENILINGVRPDYCLVRQSGFADRPLRIARKGG